MATNIVYDHGDQLALAATDPATPASGDPVLVGQLPGVALTDEHADGTTTIKFNGAATLSVHAVDSADAGVAVSAGDIVFYDAGELNADSTNGVRFGYVLEDVAAGATADVLVKIGY